MAELSDWPVESGFYRPAPGADRPRRPRDVPVQKRRAFARVEHVIFALLKLHVITSVVRQDRWGGILVQMEKLIIINLLNLQVFQK